MFFYLSKLMAFALSPLVWMAGLLLWSIFTKIERRARRLRVAALAVLFICGNSFLVDECYRAWEPVTPDHDLSAQKFDGAIVLGGIGAVDMRLQKINFNCSADRLFQVLPLLRNGRVQKLVFTGGSGSIEFPDREEGLYVGKYLRSIGFPDSNLVLEHKSRNTYENAVFTKRLMDSLGLKGNYLLVTSAYHMPRAMAVFQKAGYTNLTPYLVNKFSGVRRYTPDHLLIPNTDALFSLQLLLHEWVGFVTYKLKGYA